MKYMIISAMALAVAASCTVREDREDCACILAVDMSPCSGMSGRTSLSLKTADQSIVGDYVPGEDSPFYEYAVTKGECLLSAYSGSKADKEDAITAARGEQFPEVFAFVSRFIAIGETAVQQVRLHKQFCCITLDLSESGWGGPDHSIEVYGNVRGFTLKDLSPLKGDYYYRLPQTSSQYKSFRVPRQLDESLTLTVSDSSRVVAELKVGEILAESGFDWTEEDLQDAEIVVSGSESLVSVRISGWDPAAPINVTI